MSRRSAVSVVPTAGHHGFNGNHSSSVLLAPGKHAFEIDYSQVWLLPAHVWICHGKAASMHLLVNEIEPVAKRSGYV